MKRMISVPITKMKCDSYLVDRVKQFKDDLAKWVGKQSSNIGAQWVKFVDGKIQVKPFHFERTDCLILQYTHGGDILINVFIEPNGHSSIQPFEGELEDGEATIIYYDTVEKMMAKHTDFMARQRRWQQEKPWEKLDGMEPEQALAKLTELGW